MGNQTILNMAHNKNTVTQHIINKLSLSYMSRQTYQRTGSNHILHNVSCVCGLA